MRLSVLFQACLLAVTLPVLASCASTPELGGDPELRVLPAPELPPPTVADFAPEERPYIVGPFDRLVVDVFGIEGLSNREVQVDATGRISFPLAGVVLVAGKTPAEVEASLVLALRQAYVRDPQVAVSVKETNSRLVTIDGRVKSPGLYPVIGRMTLMRAIARAGGSGDFANLERVVIFRTVNGQRLAALYDLGGIRRGAYPDPEIFANDVIMIDDDNSQLLFRDVASVLTLLAGPIVIIADRLVN